MGECVCRIEKLENGYEVEVADPGLVAANAAPKSIYQDPWKGYAFTTDKEVLAFLTKVLPTLKPEDDDMGKAFDEACASED